MNKEDLIVVTGAAGFIAGYLVGFLNNNGYNNLILVDDFSPEKKLNNHITKSFLYKVDRNDFFSWCEANKPKIAAVYHLGARTDTTEMDYEVHRVLNLEYSKKIWELCTRLQIPLVYASSAATYGGGELGYKDDNALSAQLKPLNPYGVSKNEFDIWALNQATHPPFWAGMKFFNVYGPDEYHKARMASVIFHAFNQIRDKGSMVLFRSHNPKYEDGGQIRDFIYVKDVVKICCWLMEHQPESGLYNCGTGIARTFNDLAASVFAALNLPQQINYIDTPIDIRDKYQYFTEADMTKLKNVGYPHAFYSLEDGVKEYVTDFLVEGRYY